MTGPEQALCAAVTARLKSDAALQALLGGRVYDEAPEQPTYPYVTLTRVSGRPLRGDGPAQEHLLTLSCVSRYGGRAEARAVVAAMRDLLDDAPLQPEDHRLVSMQVAYIDVFRASDFRSVLGLVRLRAVTEPLD